MMSMAFGEITSPPVVALFVAGGIIYYLWSQLQKSNAELAAKKKLMIPTPTRSFPAFAIVSRVFPEPTFKTHLHWIMPLFNPCSMLLYGARFMVNALLASSIPPGLSFSENKAW